MKDERSYKKDLVKYRLECAREALHDAHVLNENGGSAVSVVNRSYYSVFYAALALLVTVDVEPTKHAGVLAKFDEFFIRQGIFPKEMSKIIHHAFDMRQAGDYQKSKVITMEHAIQILGLAEEFIKKVEEKLSKDN